MNADAQDLYFPGPDSEWEAVSPAARGWNEAALTHALDWCGESNAQQVLVLERGRIVAERYWQDSTPTSTCDVASAQKTVVSLLVGALWARGKLDPDSPMSRWLGRSWTKATPEQEEKILLRHLLTMTSGLFDDFSYETEPGKTWYYNNNAYHQIRKAIESVTERSCQEVSAELLFEPTGMTHSSWRERPQMLDPHGWALSGLHTTARDMGRFGLAILAGGFWGRRDLIGHSKYLATALQPSQELNPSYGYLCWRLGEPRAIVPGPPRNGRLDPRKSFGGIDIDWPLAMAAPVDTIAAMGAGDMRLYVVPSYDLVVVRHGAPAGKMAAAGGGFDQEFWSRLALALPETNPLGKKPPPGE